MDKYEQFKLEQDALLKALAENGPSENLMLRMQALYKDARLVVALGPCNAVERAPEAEAREYADEQDFAAYVETYVIAVQAGEMARIFNMEPWGRADFEYEAVEVDGRLCPGVKVSWSNKIAFLAGGKDGRFDAQLEAMAEALADRLSARWYRWQVRLV
jgi:hypothetical protein